MAFPMDLKVVKVGDIDALPGEQSILLPDISPSDSAVQLPKKGGVPDNWPQIPQLTRRRSCVASGGERTNCVNKAVEHLQLLQDILTDYVQKTEEKVSQDTDVGQTLSICGSDSQDEEGALVPLTTDLVPLRCVDALKKYKSHSQLKAVVKEVMKLLAWLQDDCQKTEVKLNSEKALHLEISLEMDEMYRQKLIGLTDTVQGGHHLLKKKILSCMKTNEALNMNRAKYQQKLKSNENLHLKLSKALVYKNNQIPLVREKMFQENQQTGNIQNDLIEAQQLLGETLKHKKTADSKYKESVKISDMEEICLDKQLNAVCHELNLQSSAAEMAKTSYSNMIKYIEDGKQQTKSNHREMAILKVKLENHKTKVNAVTLQGKYVKEDLVKRLFETRQNECENQKLETALKETKIELDSTLLHLDEERMRLMEECHALEKANFSTDAFIESMREKIKGSKIQKTFYEENQKRMSDETMTLEVQVSNALEELKQKQEEFRLLTETVQAQEAKINAKEKKLMRTINPLQNEIDNESNAYIDMANNYDEYQFATKYEEYDAKEERKEHYDKVSEIVASIDNAKDKLAKLIILRTQKSTKLDIMEDKRKDIEARFGQVIQDHEMYFSNLTAFPRQTEEKIGELERKIIKMSHEEERMKKQMAMMIEQCKQIGEELIIVKEQLEQLTEEIQELDFQLGAASNLFSNTMDRYKQALERIRTERNEHHALMRSRKETLQELLQKKQQSLEENDQLASEYRTAQITLSQWKQEYIESSENTMRLIRALKDLKQLFKVHTKVHDNNRRYCEFRGLYHSKQLAYFVNISERSQNKLKQLQAESGTKMQKTSGLSEIITDYFRNKQELLPKISHLISW